MWRGLMMMYQALSRGMDRDLSESSSLSGADYQLLVPLSEAACRTMRAGDLARLVEWEPSRLSHQIRRMQERGLLERHACSDDRRGTVIVLTERGASAIEEAAPSHVEWVREHFIDLLSDDELETLGAVASRVLERLREECVGRPCEEEGNERRFAED